MVHARRVALLFAAVSLAFIQTGDALRVRAGICQDRKCNTRVSVAFAPATVAIQVYVAQHPKNRELAYGLSCDAFLVAESYASLDGQGSDAPLFIREHRDVGPGTCQAVAILTRSDGSHHKAVSETLILKARE